MIKKSAVLIVILALLLCTACSCFKSTISCVTSTEKSDSSVQNSASGLSQDNKLKAKSTAQVDSQSVLKQKIASVMENHFAPFGSGASYGVCVYSSGEKIIHNSCKMKSASVIKLFIMEYAFYLMEKGEITYNTPVGYGTVKSLVESMITVSDNSATNTLIDYFTMEKLNEYFKTRSYNDTVLGRKMLDYNAISQGRDNFTSVKDVMKFLSYIYIADEDSLRSDMLDILSRQKVSTKIRRDLAPGVKIANKTGELGNVENDVGIIFTPNGDFALVCITNGVDSAQAQNAIAKSASSIYEIIME